MAPLSATPVPSDEDVSALLDEWKTRQTDEAKANSMAAHFLEWLEKFTASNYRERAKKAATKRWQKNGLTE